MTVPAAEPDDPGIESPHPATDASADPYDLVVIGAGPAGLTGAVTAAELGLTVALVDSAARPGGQYYRHPAPALGAGRPPAPHHDWASFTDLGRRLAANRTLTHLPEHHVWTVVRESDGTWTAHAVTGADGTDGRPVRTRGRALLLATGAHERHLPFPGWTLPGVVGAGGAQAMLGAGLVLPGRRVVVAGSGPLLLAVAASLAAAGARVPAVVEAAGYLRYARTPRVLAANPGKAAEALTYRAGLLRHRVRLRTRSAVTRVHGTERVEAVTVARLDRDWRPLPGTGRRIACDALAVGHGLVPQIELATAVGCATRVLPDGTRGLALGAEQETSVPGVWAAGETGGVGGAELARAEGETAARAIAARLLGRRADPERTALLRRRGDRLRAFADAMAAAHTPGPGWAGWLTDDTEICRCEEVSAGRVREAVTGLGARDPRTVKLLTRAGMGWCQGRMCGTAVACLASRGTSAPPPDRRLLAVPVPLSALAAGEGEPPGPGFPEVREVAEDPEAPRGPESPPAPRPPDSPRTPGPPGAPPAPRPRSTP
ncbi:MULTISPECIES: FAD-dependent oxidoreductase [unclassified Streptomyces]|uniref:FAD-dependent oxidoreductase n=1 Tax=unclassified Streptomyces TaxID=2593676 RepID=UPI00368D7A81